MYIFTFSSKPVSKTSLESLKCVSILYRWERKQKSSSEAEVTPTLAKLLSRLVYGVQGDKKLESQAKKYLVAIFRQLSLNGVLKLASNLYDVDKNLVCLSILYNWLQNDFVSSDGKKVDPFSGEGKSASAVVDLYVKEFLMTKVPKSQWVLEKVSSNLMPCIKDKADCTDTIMSAISKALLRSPETSVEVRKTWHTI